MTQAEIESVARSLIGTYFQTSRKHRHVARFPTGMRPVDALISAARDSRPWDVEEWARMLGPRSAGDHYLRVYAPREDKLDLPVAVFRAFLDLGGATYDGRRTP